MLVFIYIIPNLNSACLSKEKKSSREREGRSKVMWEMGIGPFNFLLNFNWEGDY